MASYQRRTGLASPPKWPSPDSTTASHGTSEDGAYSFLAKEKSSSHILCNSMSAHYTRMQQVSLHNTAHTIPTLTLIVMTNQSSVSTNPLRIHPPQHQAVSDNAPAKHLVVPSPTFTMAPIALNALKARDFRRHVRGHGTLRLRGCPN